MVAPAGQARTRLEEMGLAAEEEQSRASSRLAERDMAYAEYMRETVDRYINESLSAEERRSLTSSGFRMNPRERRVYTRALEALRRDGPPFVVSGLYALHQHTGIYRETKDLDVMLQPSDIVAAAEALKRAGFTLALHAAHWLAKRRDFVFFSLDEWIELRNLPRVLSLFMFAEEEQIRVVLRAPAMEEQFVLFQNGLAQLLGPLFDPVGPSELWHEHPEAAVLEELA